MSRSRSVALAIVAALVVLVVLFFPSIRQEDVLAITSHQPVAIVGNSVIRTPSKCDKDARGIPDLMKAQLGQDVLDLSVGGQTLDQSVQLAGLALANPSVRTVVMPLVVTSGLAGDSFDLQTWLFYRIANRDVAFPSLSQRIGDGRFFEGEPPINAAAFSYKGQNYPGYEGIKSRYFSSEHAAMPCPENEGSDMRFVEAYYHFVYRHPGIRDDVLRSIESLQAQADSRGKTLLYVLMPVNLQILDRLLPDTAIQVRAQAALVAARLRERHAQVIDLTASTRSDEFADVWCACGHMQETGRQRTVLAISTALASIGGATSR